MGKFYGRGATNNNNNAASKPAFKAPTPGLENDYFTTGSAKDAAQFEEVKLKLSRYVGTQSWKGAHVAAQAMELVEVEEPVFVKSAQPVKTEGKDVEFEMDVMEYKDDFVCHSSGKTAWDKNKGRMYHLVLQHCPKELEGKLKAMSSWDSVNATRNVIGLLCLVRDVTHKHDETRQGTMALVESDLQLYTTFMKDKDPESFLELFKAQINTINSHGGRAGYHPELLQ